MNHGKFRLFVFGMAVLLLLVGCQSKAPTILPVTGVQEAAPAEVILARENVLKYVLSSSRLAGLPKEADWQREMEEELENEHCFWSGDWHMIIRSADTDDGNRSIIILNKVEHTSWTGYVTPNGHVVDTAYGR